MSSVASLDETMNYGSGVPYVDIGRMKRVVAWKSLMAISATAAVRNKCRVDVWL